MPTVVVVYDVSTTEEHAMKYMMFVCTDTEPDPPTGDPKLDDVDDWVERHDASGARVMGERAAAGRRRDDRAHAAAAR